MYDFLPTKSVITLHYGERNDVDYNYNKFLDFNIFIEYRLLSGIL